MSSNQDSGATGSPFNVEDFCGQPDSDLMNASDSYEKAVNDIQDKMVQKRPGLRVRENCDFLNTKCISKKHKNSKKPLAKGNKKWIKGQNCRAVCHIDDKEYEAVICTLNYQKDQCIVKFLGYGNKENVPISSLTPSYGRQAILDQELQGESTDTDWNESLYSPPSTSRYYKPFPDDQSDISTLTAEDNGSLDNDIPDKMVQKRPGLRVRENCDFLNTKCISKTHKNSKKPLAKGNKKWIKGQNCRAVCHIDDKEYEAVICTLNYQKDQCIVKFLGYGNKENVPISSLTPSYGRQAILDQELQGESTDTDWNESLYSPPSTSRYYKPFPDDQSDISTLTAEDNGSLDSDFESSLANDIESSVASESLPSIPHPPFLPDQEQELMSSALMAWYMAGYQTGLYQASLRKKKTNLLMA